MTEVCIVLLFSIAIVAIIGIVGIFALCMYLKEFPKLKHNSKFDLKNQCYESDTELQKETDVKNVDTTKKELHSNDIDSSK